jgi:agmatine deiminase
MIISTNTGMVRMKQSNIFNSALVFLLAAIYSSTGLCQERRVIERFAVGWDVGDAALSIRQTDLVPPPAPRTNAAAAKNVGDGKLHVLDCRLPGEFEHQRALLLACNDLLNTAPNLLVEIARHAAGKIDLVVLVSNVEDYDAAKRLLNANFIPLHSIRFAELSHDTMWARDYGPIIVRSTSGRDVVVDAGYDLGRPNDDVVPTDFANLLNLPVVQMPLRLDGGNLVSNGDGLAITTQRLFEENGEIEEQSVRALLRGTYGLKRVVVLEPLVGESTGHVDMFATFTSPDTVVIGQYDPAIDEENAAILDRNAEKLAQGRTANGPLRVVRVPMPNHDDGNWRTYTNVIFANGVLMVPTYAGTDRTKQRQALATYMKLLPGWKVVGVDASRIIESAGALHCITMNLGPLSELPEFPRPQTHKLIEFEFTADLPMSTLVRNGDVFSRNTSTVIPRRVFVRSRMLVRRRLRWQQVDDPHSETSVLSRLLTRPMPPDSELGNSKKRH